MRPLTQAVVASLAVGIQLACADPSSSTRPPSPDALAAGAPSADRGGVVVRTVSMMDACDPTTFDAVLGAGACVRDGGITFADFNAQLAAHGSVGAWHFAPPTLDAREGQLLQAVNRGGETHTFTEVAHFGGGFVAVLNAASGNPVPAPECLHLTAHDFIPPGGTSERDVLDDEGTELYQCCIHPWMRTTVHVHGS